MERMTKTEALQAQEFYRQQAHELQEQFYSTPTTDERDFRVLALINRRDIAVRRMRWFEHRAYWLKD